MSSQNTGVEFRVADVEAEDFKFENKESSHNELSVVLNDGGKVIKEVTERKAAFVSDRGVLPIAALMAYNRHHGLVLRPDDIWITIGTVLAGYIDRNAERMRNVLVKHEGKIDIVVHSTGNIHNADYDDLLSQISDQIEEHTQSDIRNWMECDFTTTTDVTRTVSKLVLMSSVKNYFSFRMCLSCNLPYVRLEGTRDDWVSIKEKLKFLLTFNTKELSRWYKILRCVIGKFIDAFDGKIDREWWNKIANQVGGGSGPTYLTGWILAFTPFNVRGYWVIGPINDFIAGKSFGKVETSDIPPSVVSVPVKIDDNGKKYDTIFYTGLLSISVDDKGKSLRPNAGWLLSVI